MGKFVNPWEVSRSREVKPQITELQPSFLHRLEFDSHQELTSSHFDIKYCQYDSCINIPSSSFKSNKLIHTSKTHRNPSINTIHSTKQKKMFKTKNDNSSNNKKNIWEQQIKCVTSTHRDIELFAYLREKLHLLLLYFLSLSNLLTLSLIFFIFFSLCMSTHMIVACFCCSLCGFC